MIEKAMDKQKKDKLSKYGKLICEFANAKTTDDILISFFENLQSAFNFSKNFTKKALKEFPIIKVTIDKLRDDEKKLLESIFLQNKVLKLCNHFFNKASLHIVKYDPINSLFVVSEQFQTKDSDDNIHQFQYETSRFTKEKINSIFFQKIRIDNEKKDKLEAKLNAELDKIISLSNQIEEIKEKEPKRFAAFDSVIETYQKIYKLHDYVKGTQDFLKGILSQITKSGDAYESEVFKIILEQYNNIQQKTYFDKKKHQLLKSKPFIEENFLSSDSRFDLKEIFNLPIIYCLVEVLTEEENIRKVKNCNKCNNYFIEKRRGKKLYCTDKCRLDYHNKKNIESGKHAEYMRGKRQEGNPKYY